ncbi:MAG TPA: hypothetical protein VJ201_01110 [Candidatus Babeliales bacterium]|nr:hypothetical protein [Candidatus Babeliales bacterium]
MKGVFYCLALLCVTSYFYLGCSEASLVDFDQLFPSSRFDDVLRFSSYAWSDLNWCSNRDFRARECQVSSFCNRMLSHLMSLHKSLVLLEQSSRLKTDNFGYLMRILGMTNDQIKNLKDYKEITCADSLGDISYYLTLYTQNIFQSQNSQVISTPASNP